MENERLFKVGDIVEYTNGNEIYIGLREVIGFQYCDSRGWCYFIKPTDSPWFAVSESQLKLHI